MPTLKELLTADASIERIAAHLDALSHPTRIEQVRELGRAEQRRLYQKAAGSPPLLLEDLVPASVPPGRQVVHHGKNTLPIPGFTLFQKPMCRPDDGSLRVFGFNEGNSRPLVGPGYFVALPTAGRPEWERRGPVVVDYFQVPDGPVPSGWPKVVPNSEGLQRFVFHGTRDFLRKVSTHVTIGAAYKGEKPLDHYFTLCRED